MSALNDINNYPMHAIKQQTFQYKYAAYSASIYWNNKNNHRLESTDKIVLPPSALSKLTRINILGGKNPILFEIANNSDILPKKTHCSVIEFTAEEGTAYLPLQIMDNLGLDYHGNDTIELTTVHLPKGQLVQVQPHKTEEILSLSSIPKHILEKQLTNYSCLTLGDTVQVEYRHAVYKFDITQVKPCIVQSTAPPAISIIECDIEIDFKEPRDYKQWQKHNIVQRENDLDESESSSVAEIEDDSKDQSESNDDHMDSPDYFAVYGANEPSTPESQSQSSNIAFSFKDVNKGFTFCKNTRKDDKKASK
eukprot:162515_1